jgi:hypothetical protein
VFLVTALSSTACTVTRDANSDHGCEACPAGSCYMGFCILGGATDPNPAVGQPSPGDPCDDDAEPLDCYEGEAETRGVGACEVGTMNCTGGVWTSCQEQGMPADAESCNAVDDDCDGRIDEGIELASCVPQGPGACQTGKEMCVDGKVECHPVAQGPAEVCNGTDDDCDGKIDEAIVERCYTSAAGCVEDVPGHFRCDGSCTEGARQCVDGRLAECEDEIIPVEERCEGSGAAGDENCDGRTNEGCACLQNDAQECYGGPRDTAGIGTCRPGRQVCVQGAFDDCDGDVTPADETCANEGEDNNCNGMIDDIPMLGTRCSDPDARGVCQDGTLRCSGGGASLVCETPEPVPETCNGLDDDCDDETDETFTLQTDEENCGRCGVECTGTTQECCAGVCAAVGCGIGGAGGAGGAGGTGGTAGAAGEGAAGQAGDGAAGGP